MITINFFEHCCGFKITNDKIFEDMTIYPRDFDHEKELINDIIVSLIKDN